MINTSNSAGSHKLKSDGGSTETIVIVDKKDGSDPLPRLCISLTKRDYMQLEKEVVEIKDKINELMELPHNLGIVEALRYFSRFIKYFH